MKFIDINPENEAQFLRCLHPENEDSAVTIQLRKERYLKNVENGLTSKLIADQTDEVVGLFQYIPIEKSFVDGNNLMMILCMWIKKQKSGIGKASLQFIEAEALKKGMKGIAAWGMDFPYWNPISWYVRNGFKVVDRKGSRVLALKKFSENVEEPKFIRSDEFPEILSSKPSIVSFLNGWCLGGCGNCISARKAASELKDEVNYIEYDSSDRVILGRYGIDDGVYIDNHFFTTPDGMWTDEDLIREVQKRRIETAKDIPREE